MRASARGSVAGMAGEAESIRAWARVLHREADGLRATAFRVRMVAATVRWRSPAADAFRARVAARAGSLQSASEALREAAAAMEAHATAVESAQRTLAELAELAGRALR